MSCRDYFGVLVLFLSRNHLSILYLESGIHTYGDTQDAVAQSWICNQALAFHS